jgi:hypothetical protein
MHFFSIPQKHQPSEILVKHARTETKSSETTLAQKNTAHQENQATSNA